MNISVSQAMASGLPVIATRHSGLPEQVHDGIHGLLVREGDCHDLAEKILSLMYRAHEWGAFGRRAREHVLVHYHAETNLRKQFTLYEKIIDQDKG